MSRTIGHDYREHTGYKLYLQELRERKYGKRQVVKALLKKETRPIGWSG